jgi:squalene-associated FAD-dependent desaturase
MTTRTNKPSVVIVGGGLAGLSAAVTAADAGWAVTLLESRPRLGGATHSFTRAFEDGEIVVDNGQHVFLRCCTAYREFISRLGVEDQTFVQSRLDVPVVDPATGRISRLRRDRLPAPLHLSRALLTYRLLTPWQRIRAIVAMLKLDRVDRFAPSSDTQTFGSWLAAHGQSKQVLERLIDVFTVATLNAPSAQVSLTLGAMVFQDGLLRKADACDIGISRVPLGQLHGDAAAKVLANYDADIRLRTRVRAVTSIEGGRWRVDTDDTSIEADAVVLAVPHDVAADLLPAGSIADPALVRGLDVSPILNVHVIFDRVVLTEPFIAAVDSPAQFVFDRTKASGLRSGQYVAVSVSAADAWIDQPVAALRDEFMPELLRVLPGARDAVVRDFFVTREREATFRPVPGSAARRLPTTTNAPGLVVAGAWTATGWPATMESAVRSGVAAAHALQEWRGAVATTEAAGNTEAAVHEASA